LKAYNPYRIFVCADLDARIDNCLYYQQTNGAETVKEIAKNIQKVDKIRSHNNFAVTGYEWGDPSNYDLVINTTNWEEFDSMAPVFSAVALKWFENHGM
jgi:cytidylate kinase